MKLRTELYISDKQLTISYSSKIALIGSCFSDSIGKILTVSQFDALVNPFKTVFNPLIICKLLIRSIDKVYYTPDELVADDKLYFNYELHSKYSHLNPDIFLKRINKQIDKTHTFIKDADILILTLGTSIGYYLANNGEVVGNCHKQSSRLFEKKGIPKDDIVNAFDLTFKKLKILNPKLQILFTVSPIRHTREGLVENTLSKAVLITTVHQLLANYSWVHYFPSYEIMMDDLRDYRFYKRDLIHPNSMAIAYIFEKFSEAYFDERTLEQLKKVQKVVTAIKHKSILPKSEKNQQFLKQTLSKIDVLRKELDRDVFKKPYKRIQKQFIN